MGDRPCLPHKVGGARCDTCDQFEPDGTRVLLVKLAASGDVLRTTAVLEGLRRTHAPCSITWVTAADSVPLITGHPEIDRIVSFSGALPVELSCAPPFDLTLNLDSAPDACALAAAVPSHKRIGFGLAEDGKPAPLTEGARTWFEMGLDDDAKRGNRRTFYEHLADVAEVPIDSRPRLFLNERARSAAARILARHGLARCARLVGLNTGAGARWPLKKWTFDGQVELVKKLTADPTVSVVLLGGPEERARNQALSEAVGDAAIHLGCEHPIPVFAALIERLAVLVTGDTLAMQIATALGVQQVVLFGPTSSAEIDLFGRGEKISSSAMDCLVCYLTACDKDPNCMNTISSDVVHAAVLRQFETSESQTT